MSVVAIPGDITRIDLDERGVDDVAISVRDGMYRLERMSDRSFWSCIYMPDNTRHVFWFYAKKGHLTVEHSVEDLG